MMSLLSSTKQFLHAIDFGTTKFSLGSIDLSVRPLRISTSSVQARGMRRGMLSCFEEAKACLEHLLERAEKDLETDISQVVIGVAGSHLKSEIKTSTMSIKPQPLSAHILNQLALKAERDHQIANKHILHVLPIKYWVDDREPVHNPQGFTGHNLSAEFLMIYADQSYLKDLVRLCNECGVQVANIFSEPFASASVTVADAAKQLGCAVADIGGGTTDGIVFQDGRPARLFTVNIASKMITQDIALAFQLSPEEAERVKTYFGLSAEIEGEFFKSRKVDGSELDLQWRDVVQVVGARAQELASALGAELVPFKGHLAHGLFLTGGGANLKGLDRFMHELFKIPVKVAKPNIQFLGDFDHCERNAVSSSAYSTRQSTLLGLLNLELARMIEEKARHEKTLSGKYLTSFINWIKELS